MAAFRAATGSGRLLTGFGGALALAPLPTCNGVPELAGTTITSCLSTACLVMVRRQLLRQLAVRPRVCSSRLPLILIPRVQTTADVGSECHNDAHSRADEVSVACR